MIFSQLVGAQCKRMAEARPDERASNTEASSTAEWQVQAYFDHTFRSQPGIFEESRGTFDLEVEYRARTFPRHTLLAGGGYRFSHDHTSVPPSPGGPPTAAVAFG